MAKRGGSYVCQQCGFESAKWLGKCPNCSAWASFVEFIDKGTSRLTKGSTKAPAKIYSLKDIDPNGTTRLITKIAELDLVLGGGLVPGQVILLAGEPGIGKSTLLLQLTDKIGDTIYISGEESVGQIKVRADRMGLMLSNALFVEETNVDVVLATLNESIKKSNIKAIIIDSVQTMYTEDLTGAPGSVGQVREATLRLITFAKREKIPVVLIGHVTKDGTVAGPSTLAHMVDTVLWFEGEKVTSLRVLRSIKNRFATTDEVAIFQMTNSGLTSTNKIELMFLGEDTPKGAPGSVISCMMEGTRAILVEIQALVVPTKLAFSRRVVHGIDSKRVELIIAVLTRHCGLSLSERDIFVNVVGGLKVKDPGIDLAVAMAIASSYKNKPVKGSSLVIGEVGLLGEIRKTTFEQKRIERAARQGFVLAAGAGKVKLVSQAIRTSLV